MDDNTIANQRLAFDYRLKILNPTDQSISANIRETNRSEERCADAVNANTRIRNETTQLHRDNQELQDQLDENTETIGTNEEVIVENQDIVTDNTNLIAGFGETLAKLHLFDVMVQNTYQAILLLISATDADALAAAVLEKGRKASSARL